MAVQCTMCMQHAIHGHTTNSKIDLKLHSRAIVTVNVQFETIIAKSASMGVPCVSVRVYGKRSVLPSIGSSCPLRCAVFRCWMSASMAAHTLNFRNSRFVVETIYDIVEMTFFACAPLIHGHGNVCVCVWECGFVHCAVEFS